MTRPTNKLGLRLPASLAASALLALAAAATAGATSTGLHVIASARSSGDLAVTAVNGSKSNAHALYIRGYGRGLSGTAVVACQKGFTSIGSKSTDLRTMTSGRLYKLTQPFVGDCQITASLSGSGPIRLQLLG